MHSRLVFIVEKKKDRVMQDTKQKGLESPIISHLTSVPADLSNHNEKGTVCAVSRSERPQTHSQSYDSSSTDNSAIIVRLQ